MTAPRKLLIFAGTTEGSAVTQAALARGHAVTVSVATAYGAELFHELPVAPTALTLLQGRRTETELLSLVPAFDAVIDATHPYAATVTQSLRTVCQTTQTPYYRLLRQPQHIQYERLQEFSTLTALVDALFAVEGNIFVATGSKELSAFSVLPRYRERLFVRVLPSVEALQACERVQLPASHIIAMQGAFSCELNAALFRQYECSALVTKESGAAGGYAEKIEAARALSMDVYALLPPVEATARVFTDAAALLTAVEEEVRDD